LTAALVATDVSDAVLFLVCNASSTDLGQALALFSSLELSALLFCNKRALRAVLEEAACSEASSKCIGLAFSGLLAHAMALCLSSESCALLLHNLVATLVSSVLAAKWEALSALCASLLAKLGLLLDAP